MMQSFFPFSVHIHPQGMKVKTQNSTKISLYLGSNRTICIQGRSLGLCIIIPCSICFPRQHMTPLMAKAILQETPQLPALGCPNNVHGVTTTGLHTSFVHYMNKCVLLLHLTFHAVCPIHSCSFSPQYASLFHNTPIVSGEC